MISRGLLSARPGAQVTLTWMAEQLDVVGNQPLQRKHEGRRDPTAGVVVGTVNQQQSNTAASATPCSLASSFFLSFFSSSSAAINIHHRL